MPVFEYKCKDCGCEFEELVFGNDEVRCPACDSDKTRKKISTFAAKTSSGSGGNRSSSCTNYT